jgi:hypothetical protein
MCRDAGSMEVDRRPTADTAQRIIAITDADDQGLIALATCQAYVRDILH